MKNIVLKVPTFFLTIGVITPLIIFGFTTITNELPIETGTLKILFAIASAIKLVWLFSIVDYFQSKLENFNYLKLIYFFLTIDAIVTFMNFLIIESPSLFTEIVLLLLPIGIHIATTVFITLLINKVFYKRSVWFIVIEIFTIVVGVITLTPEIKQDEMELNRSSDIIS